jgi:3-oxoacyl-[acyl-carrier-protein] synthase-3
MGAVQRAAIYGTGAYAPPRVLANDDFATIYKLDTGDEWITSRTGIKRRHIADATAVTSDLCLHASRAAFENAQVKPEEIDLIVVGTISPDYPFPSTACVLQHKLGLAESHIPAFDLSAACSGFGYGLSVAQAFVLSGQARRVLVVGAEILSRIMDFTDRGTCILFGDGAGAAIVGPARTAGTSHSIVETKLHSDGAGAGLLNMPAGGTARPTSAETVAEKLHYLRMGGREVFRFGVQVMIDTLKDIFERHRLTAADVGAIIPHHANIRIIEAAAERLNLPMELFLMNLEEYGNTSAASIPMALDFASRAGKLRPGKPVILLGFGAGLTWASAVLEW